MPRLRPAGRIQPRARKVKSQAVRAAITGGLASGKSTALKVFRQSGWKIFSADEAVHRIYAQHSLQLEPLRRAAKKSSAAVRRLERFVHPRVGREIQSFLRENSRKPCLVEIPLLFEVKWEGRFDLSIFVFCPKALRQKRAQRRGMKRALFGRLDRLQLPAFEKAQRADYVLQNFNDRQALRKQAKILARLLKASY
jgi:dephospho-CoA kinase